MLVQCRATVWDGGTALNQHGNWDVYPGLGYPKLPPFDTPPRAASVTLTGGASYPEARPEDAGRGRGGGQVAGPQQTATMDGDTPTLAQLRVRHTDQGERARPAHLGRWSHTTLIILISPAKHGREQATPLACPASEWLDIQGRHHTPPPLTWPAKVRLDTTTCGPYRAALYGHIAAITKHL